MRSRKNYEWVIEEIDEHGDIQDCTFEDTLANFGNLLTSVDDVSYHLGLVLTYGNDEDGCGSRFWSYCINGQLPEHFEDASGCIADRVPKRFHQELARHMSNVR